MKECTIENINPSGRYFENPKISRTFAMYTPGTFFTTLLIAAIFMSVSLAKIGYQIPADCCIERSVIVLGGTGGDSLSFLSFCNSSFAMPSTMNIVNSGNNSTCMRTSNRTKSVSINTHVILAS